MRAISTVLDVVVFLLLLSAAVGVLSQAPAGEPNPVEGDDTATMLATTTADIRYSLAGAERHAHGTVATLLGRGAVANVSIDGHSVRSVSTYRAQLERVIIDSTPAANRTQMVARWVPYRGAPVSGEIAVGATPPPGADVSATRLSVPGPDTPITPSMGQISEDGYRGVAAAAAREVTSTLLPGTGVDASVGRNSTTATTSGRRFRSFASAVDVSVDAPLAAGDVSTARRRVAAALTDRFERDMRDRFDSPHRAAQSLRTGTVDVVVRRWEQ